MLSFQWAGLRRVLIDEEREMLGGARFQHMEPAARTMMLAHVLRMAVTGQ